MALQCSDIQMRDPFVLPLPQEDRYLLFGTTDKNMWSGPGTGFDCYSSRDLVNWDGPIPAFRPPADFWSNTQSGRRNAMRGKGATTCSPRSLATNAGAARRFWWLTSRKDLTDCTATAR